ncbi:hypothetical protein [Natranaerovirga pectinivora]|nr:hypothetical protein [Natranaerovirga pectinivora]
MFVKKELDLIMNKKRCLKLILFSFIKSLIQLLVLVSLSIIIRPYVLYVTRSNINLNAFNILLFQPLVSDTKATLINISSIFILWLLLIGITNLVFKKFYSVKNKVGFVILESLFLTAFLQGIEYYIAGTFTWFIPLFITIFLFNASILLATMPYIGKTVYTIVGIFIFPVTLFALFFSLNAGIFGEISFWIMVPNVIVYIFVLALGGNVNIGFTNEILIISGFNLGAEGMYYSYIEGVFSYIFVILLLGILLLLLASFYGNPRNNLKNQIFLIFYFFILIFICILISSFSFEFPFLGTIALSVGLGNSLIFITVFLFIIFLLRKILKLHIKEDNTFGTDEQS